MRIFTFDTTLRDGAQGEGVSFSVDDKLAITQALDELGIDYIEGGWPTSNPKDEAFFVRARELKLRNARLTAFSSTRLAKNPVHQDHSVLGVLKACTPAVSIFGKSWNLQVTEVLGISLEENLKLISETVRYLKEHGREVIFDAEHFFDGFAENSAYALQTLEAAKLAGADVLCLCDTNGGSLPAQLAQAVSEVRQRFDGVIGIHAHNDSDLAVANSLAAVGAGATLVQGCLNGYGERCGNANLASIIANLELKQGHTTIGRDRLARLAPVCSFIAETANVPFRNDQPFVGKSAFAHKGGVHVSAVLKNAATYEHVVPGAVGNSRRVLISDLAGRANIKYKLKQYGFAGGLDDAKRLHLLERIKVMEHEGYDLEAADGTFELLVRMALHPDAHSFDVENYYVSTGQAGADPLQTTATVTVRAQEQVYSASARGRGPLHALHRCLRICFAKRFPEIRDIHVTDYKVRLLDARKGTAGKVRVLVGWSDHSSKWSTVGISDNLVEASWKALADAMRLQLMRIEEARAARAQHWKTNRLAGGSAV